MFCQLMKHSPRAQTQTGIWCMALLAVVLLLCAAPSRADSLNSSNIVTWNLTVTSPDTYPPSTATSVDIIGPGIGDNSQLGLVGSDLTSTSTALFFNFSGTDNGYLLFQTPTLFNGANFWCLATTAYSGSPSTNLSCSDQTVVGESVAVIGPTVATPLSGNVEIASGGTVVGTDIVYNVDQSWTINGQTFSVVGTITTDGTITQAAAVPEPGTLRLFLSGMSGLILLARIKRLQSSLASET